MFCRSQLILTPLAESRCVQDERCGVTWLKSMPCIGEQIPGRLSYRILRFCLLPHSGPASNVEQKNKSILAVGQKCFCCSPFPQFLAHDSRLK